MLTIQRLLSLILVALVAGVTLISRPADRLAPYIGEDTIIDDDLGQRLVLVVIALVAVALVGLIWKSGLAARLKMSWPFLLVAAVCLVGFALLVLWGARGAPFGLKSSAPAVWLHWLVRDMDPGHAVAYAVLTAVVVLAWRDKIPVPALVLALLAYGGVLELLQAFVPAREPDWGDFSANGLGIVAGLVAVLTFDQRDDVHGGRSRRAHGERRRRSSRGGSPSRGWRRAGLIAAVAGLLIALASLVIGSSVELRLAHVVWQVLGGFTAAYAFTFWLGVLLAVVGILLQRGSPDGRRRRARAEVR